METGEELVEDPLKIREERRKYQIEWRNKNPTYNKEWRKKNTAKVKAADRKQFSKRNNKKIKLVELFGDKCLDCKYTYNSEMYEFHHRVPSDKKFSLKASNLGKAWEKIMVEASKTDMLCCNCHRARHILMKQEGRTTDVRAKKRTNGTSETTGPRKGSQATLPGI